MKKKKFRKKKVIRKGEHPEVEEAVYNWFLQKRNDHIPISSEILRAKAKFFYEKITGKDDFLASSGWLDKFKKRHGIRFLKVCGEKCSSDVGAVEPFQKKFIEVIREMNLSEEQVYNADESAAFWRILPGTTWVHEGEKSAPGRKISKDRVTFMPCSNAAGSHKLPLLVIGKAAKPRAFQNAHLPVIYRATKKGWMSTALFFDWFKHNFIPEVKKILKAKNMPLKALLVLDNAPSHPKEHQINFDPNFRVLFLPPNCTAIIQPMDQNLIQNVKVNYRKQLLEHILTENDSNIVQILKKFNLKNAVINLDIAWQSITPKNIKKSWSSLWPQLSSDWEEEDLMTLHDLRLDLQSTSVHADLRAIKNIVDTLNPNNQISEPELADWATGANDISLEFSDEQLIHSSIENDLPANLSATEDDDDIMSVTRKVSYDEAKSSFETCIRWAEQNDMSITEILLLKRMEEKVRENFLKKAIQPKINHFFTNSA